MLSEADDLQFEVGLQSQASLLHNSFSENQAHLGTTEQAEKLTFPPTCSSPADSMGTECFLLTRHREESGRGLGGVRERSGRSQEKDWEESGEDWEESGRDLGGVRERSGRSQGEVWEESGRGLGEGGPWANPSFEEAVQEVGLPLTVGVYRMNCAT